MSNVPKIVNELWEVMGETGETIRQSVLWLVESVSNSFYRMYTSLPKRKKAPSNIFEVSLLAFILQMRNLYERIVKVLNGLATGETMEQISQYLQGVASKYDKVDFISIIKNMVCNSL